MNFWCRMLGCILISLWRMLGAGWTKHLTHHHGASIRKGTIIVVIQVNILTNITFNGIYAESLFSWTMF